MSSLGHSPTSPTLPRCPARGITHPLPTPVPASFLAAWALRSSLALEPVCPSAFTISPVIGRRTTV